MLVNLAALIDDAKCFALVRRHCWPEGVAAPVAAATPWCATVVTTHNRSVCSGSDDGGFPGGRGQEVLGVALALDMDRGRRVLDLLEVFRRSSTPSAPTFSSSGCSWWCRDRHDPGRCASSQASAICAGVAFFSAAIRFSRSTSAWFFSIASGVNRGRILRKSFSASRVSLDMTPVRKPLPSGL